MKILIIEDEYPAAEKLSRYLQKYDASVQVMAQLRSVKDTVEWLSSCTERPDVIFMDIQLTDGLSFEIFDKVEVPSPVIFTTAFEDYALDAFKVNSIDYIMKPVTYTDLSAALKKLDNLKSQLTHLNTTSRVVQSLSTTGKIKDRYVVNKGTQIRSIRLDDIQLFYAVGRTVFLVTLENERFIIDYNLGDIEGLVPGDRFFRVNRSHIININAIGRINKYSNSRLKVIVPYQTDDEIVVSRDRVAAFKAWLEGSQGE